MSFLCRPHVYSGPGLTPLPHGHIKLDVGGGGGGGGILIILPQYQGQIAVMCEQLARSALRCSPPPTTHKNLIACQMAAGCEG